MKKRHATVPRIRFYGPCTLNAKYRPASLPAVNDISPHAHLLNTAGLDAQFNLFLPANASESNKVPLLTYLSGLTCTEDNA